MTLRKTEEIFGLILVVNLKPDEWKKEKDDFSVSDTGGSEEKIRLPHSIERLHCDVAGWLVLEWLRCLPPRKCFVLSSRGSFLERPGNFSGPKENFIVKTGWIAAQFLAHKPVNCASLTDRFILISFSKLLEPWSWMQTRRRRNSFTGPKRFRDFQEKGPWDRFS